MEEANVQVEIPVSKKLSSDSDIPQRITVENYIIIWLDGNLNLNNQDNQSTLVRFQQLVNLILCFSNPDQCIDCISEIKTEKIFLITTGSLGKTLISLLNNFEQIDSIYIYCNNKDYHQKWTNDEKKIKGIFTRIQPIYDAIRRDLRQCDDDLISFHILSSTYNKNENLTHSDQLFLYTQLMKEILFEIKSTSNIKEDFINFCYSIYQNNQYQLNIIKEFHKDYQQSSSVWWYTRECFISSILNKAFRLGDMDMLLKMNFFIQDLHQELQRLYKNLNEENCLTCYRGQGISEENFQQILDNQNGFLAFNNFLLTTRDKDLSLIYARTACNDRQLIGILFQIEINPKIPLYISLNKISYYSESEREILFSTHTIFRIHTIDQIDNNLWQITLKLTMNETEQLKDIKEFIRKDIDGKDQQEQLDILMNKFQTLYGIETQVIEMKNEISDQINEQETTDLNENQLSESSKITNVEL